MLLCLSITEIHDKAEDSQSNSQLINLVIGENL